jgi:hypothetical protein
MKRLIFSGSFSLMLFVYSEAYSADARNHEYPWGPASSGLVSKIWVSKHKFERKEPIEFRCIHKSVSENPFSIWDSNFWPNHFVRLLDEKGTEVQRTPTGEKAARTFSPGGERMKNVEIVLNPGQEDEGSWWDLTKFFNLETSGLYSLQIVYEEYQESTHKNRAWKGKCSSNVIVFEVR